MSHRNFPGNRSVGGISGTRPGRKDQASLSSKPAPGAPSNPVRYRPLLIRECERNADATILSQTTAGFWRTSPSSRPTAIPGDDEICHNPKRGARRPTATGRADASCSTAQAASRAPLPRSSIPTAVLYALDLYRAPLRNCHYNSVSWASMVGFLTLNAARVSACRC